MSEAYSIKAAAHQIQVLVSADGARLDVVEIGPGEQSIRFRLDLSDAGCAECVIPPRMLAETVTQTMRQFTGDENLLVAIDDPRTSVST